MADQTRKTKLNQLSKGGRTYVRRLKQIARKSGTSPNLPARSPRPSVPKKKEDLP
jgi:hypothetical protein